MISDYGRIESKLARSKFRARFRLDEKDRAYIERVGIKTVESHARDFVRTRLAPATPNNDGKQTPFSGHPVFKAQHATATCCRGCLLKWYQVPKARPLTDAECAAIVRLLMGWIQAKALLTPTMDFSYNLRRREAQ